MAKVIFTDEERETAKSGRSLMYAVVILPPDNTVKDGGFYRAGVLTPEQAEDLSDAVAMQLRKFRTVS